MKHEFQESHAWMCDSLEEAFEIIREVRNNLENENAAPVAGYKRIWTQLDKALVALEAAKAGIESKGYPDMEDTEATT